MCGAAISICILVACWCCFLLVLLLLLVSFTGWDSRGPARKHGGRFFEAWLTRAACRRRCRRSTATASRIVTILHTRTHTAHTHALEHTRAHARAEQCTLSTPDTADAAAVAAHTHTHTCRRTAILRRRSIYISTRSKFAHRNTNTPRTAPFFVG